MSRERTPPAVRRERLGGAALAVRLPLLALLAVLPPLSSCGKPEPAPAAHEGLLALEQTGVAHLERYDEDDLRKAVEILSRVSEKAPDWREARVNLLIALAATNQPDDLSRALQESARILAEDPWEPHALFVSALVNRFQGRTEAAIPPLERLLALDPDDAGVHYWLGTLESERGEEDLDKAEALLRRAVQLAPNDLSAMYGLYGVMMRQGKGSDPEAVALLHRFQGAKAAEGFGSGALVKHLTRGQNEYGEAGRYAMAIRDLSRPAGACFHDASEGPRVPRIAGPTGIACGDVDGDGVDDLFLVSAGGTSALLRNDGHRFVEATKGSGLEDVRGTAALFADVDDDGLVDLAVAGDRLRLFRNAGNGRFEEVPADRLGAAAGKAYRTLSFADLDHDGDLDLLAAGDECLWLRNNRDGTWMDATAERRVGSKGARGIVAFDADGDFVQDLVWFSASGPPLLQTNGRLDPFVSDPRLAALGDAVSGTVGDADGDGLVDLVLVRPDGSAALARGDGEGRYVLDPTFPHQQFGATSAAVADFDRDGRPDVLLVGKRVTFLRGLPRGGWRAEGLALPEVERTAFAVLDADGDGDLDVVLVEAAATGGGGGGTRFLENVSPPARHSLRLRVSGVADRVEGRTWSNARGIGADVEALAGDVAARQVVLAGSGFPGQMTDEVVLGLGDRARAEQVRVHWTDGVLQSEFDVAADQVHRIVEVNRKIASCPVLFAWTGSQFEYVTDTLGAGGLGFYLGPKIGYAPPDPTEVLRLPRLAAKDGRYEVRLVENLEEVSYLDAARLVAVDHPAGTVVHADERFAAEPPLPADRFYAVADPIAPVAATDGAGKDVLANVLAEDRDTVDGFGKDPRFLGFAKDHALVLDFGDRLTALPKDARLVLFLAGWIEYGYSKTVYGAAQAGIEMEPPVLEVPDGAGGWRKAATIGYPAGNPRTMTYDVTGILGPQASRCRIRTNLEVYWDRVFLGVDVAEGRLATTSALPASSDLRERGYPREYSPDGRSPTLYDYSVCEAWIPFRTMTGAYTKFGDVTPLVRESDDQFAIFGKGEEVAISFPESAFPAAAPGTERTWFLRLDGYCKDKDPYTALGDTVEPLPFHAMSNYPYPSSERYPTDLPHRTYRARWLTRVVR